MYFGSKVPVLGENQYYALFSFLYLSMFSALENQVQMRLIKADSYIS